MMRNMIRRGIRAVRNGEDLGYRIPSNGVSRADLQPRPGGLGHRSGADPGSGPTAAARGRTKRGCGDGESWLGHCLIAARHGPRRQPWRGLEPHTCHLLGGRSAPAQCDPVDTRSGNRALSPVTFGRATCLRSLSRRFGCSLDSRPRARARVVGLVPQAALSKCNMISPTRLLRRLSASSDGT